MPNRSYCSRIIDECYSINQYEYDEYKPDEFVRICKYEVTSDHSVLDYKNKILNLTASHDTDVLSTMGGWLSFVSVMLSIAFMIATLVTYALFKELRTIPGWLVINLTLTLCFAQFFFLLGSLVNQSPVTCFVVSIVTHYAFLSSFAWMHVVAFDLYR